MFNAISHQKNANENHNQYQYNLTGVAKIKINDNTGCLGEEEAGERVHVVSVYYFLQMHVNL